MNFNQGGMLCQKETEPGRKARDQGPAAAGEVAEKDPGGRPNRGKAGGPGAERARGPAREAARAADRAGKETNKKIL